MRRRKTPAPCANRYATPSVANATPDSPAAKTGNSPAIQAPEKAAAQCTNRDPKGNPHLWITHPWIVPTAQRTRFWEGEAPAEPIPGPASGSDEASPSPFMPKATALAGRLAQTTLQFQGQRPGAPILLRY